MQRPEYQETPEFAVNERGVVRLNHRRYPPWLGAPAHQPHGYRGLVQRHEYPEMLEPASPAHRPHGHPGLVQRPEYPETHEPALGSIKAFSQDDEVPLGKPAAVTLLAFRCSAVFRGCRLGAARCAHVRAPFASFTLLPSKAHPITSPSLSFAPARFSQATLHPRRPRRCFSRCGDRGIL